MARSLSFRPYESGDENAIRELFELTFGRPLSEEYWRWRFRDNPTGQAFVQLAWDGSTLVGHYAASRVMLSVDGQEMLTGLSGTTMTHPDYRGCGIFVKLAQRTYDLMAESGGGLIWGFPNVYAHRGRVRDLHWVDIYEIPFFRRQIDTPLPLPKPDGNIVDIKEFDSRFDQLWEQARQNHRVAAKRDSHYLQWRYVDNPKEQYRFLSFLDGNDPLGYVVFKSYKEEFQIVDILAKSDTEIGIQLILRIAQIARSESVAALSLWLNVTQPLHRSLEKLGFVNSEPITYFGGRVLSSDIPTEHIYTYWDWHLTMGDSDVF